MPIKENVLVCYRGACTNAADPRGYNRITHGLYCLDCARLINARTDLEPLGVFFPLLDLELPQGGSWDKGIIIVRIFEDPTLDNWPLNCPYECHQIGGPWISENPSCPEHGSG